MTFEFPLLVLLVMTAAGAIIVKDLISAVFILGSYSFALALVWALLGAVDVAFVEAVVGAGLATVFFLLTLFSVQEPRLCLLDLLSDSEFPFGIHFKSFLLKKIVSLFLPDPCRSAYRPAARDFIVR